MGAPNDLAYVARTRLTATPPQTIRANQTARKPLSMRKYHIQSLKPDGTVKTSDQIGPAMPIFEAAFSAFAHGTLISTALGPVAVEDLQPGMEIVTGEKSTSPLLWIGSMTLMPRNTLLPDGGCLTRITADSFGMNRPARDLMVGPGARVMLRRTGEDRPLTPAHDLADGVHAIQITPQSPVTTYHLCLGEHAVISANGMEAESFHPGAGFERSIGPNMLSLFLSFFPHIREPRDFGPLAQPRLPLGDHDRRAELA